MNLADVTPLILTYNEEANLARILGQLRWAAEIVVIDSGSTDRTREIAISHSNVRFVVRPLDTLAGQSNYGIAHVRTPWILLLDADYFVPDAFADELRTLQPPETAAAYRAAFRYAVDGVPLRASLYPPRAVMLRRGSAEVWQDGHAHRVRTAGSTHDLATAIVHDDRKPFARFIARQRHYMRQEARKLREAGGAEIGLAGRIRKLVVVAPFAVAFHSLFVKGLILDGWPGLRYAFERFVAECILSVELLKPSPDQGAGGM